MTGNINLRAAIGAVGALALLGSACADHGGDPTAAIEAYVAEYNAGDLEGVMALFAEDAVMTGHPLDARASGRAEIRAAHAAEVGGPGRYTISNLEASGDTVTWDHVWGGDDGEAFEFCVDGLQATVEDGRITSWTWPETDFSCGG